MTEIDLPDLPDLLAARRALAGVVVRTPVLRSDLLDEIAGARLFFKAEGLQITGSFKIRGAFKRIRTFTPEELASGLITCLGDPAPLATNALSGDNSLEGFSEGLRNAIL